MSGEIASERRGGDTKSSKYQEKLNGCKKIIESLTYLESHYCRGRSSKKQYLPSYMSIKNCIKCTMTK